MDLNVNFCSKNDCLDRCGVNSEKTLLCELLPDGYNYTVCQYDVIDAGITALLRLDIKTEEDAHTWLRLFQEKTLTTLRVAWKGAAGGQKNVFSVQYRCQHGSHRKCRPVSDMKPGSKITNCPATLSITVKRVMKRSRSMDIHATDLPTVIRLSFTHNHPLKCPEALYYRDVSEEVTKTFKKLFESGHSPSTALHAYKYHLQEKYGDDFEYASADRAICPDEQWSYRLYYKILKENYGCPDGEAMLQDLEQKVSSYNTGEDATECESAEDGTQDDAEHQLNELLEQVQEKFAQKMKENPRNFILPLKEFVTNLDKIKTESSLESALYCFGDVRTYNSGLTIKVEPTT